MNWFLLSLIAILFWSGSDLFSKMGAKPEDTVLVGDTKYDVEGARRCGVPCLGVRYGYAAEGELEAAGAIDIVEDMAGLQEWLLK